MAGEFSMLAEIDVCVVATRRPMLLERTLRSFQEGLFRHFTIRHFVANIDPAFGSEKEGEDCAALVRSYDPDAQIRMAERPGFAAAVASVWSATSTEVILHLEDDWLLTHAVRPDHLQPFLDYPWLGQISFNHANKAWDVRKRGAFPYASRFVKLFGRKLSIGPQKPSFVTGPSFLRGSFARRSATLMNLSLDPEKQFCRDVNRPLQRYAADYRNMIVGEIGAYYIEDLGRQWRKDKGIEKRTAYGRSEWIEQGDARTASTAASANGLPVPVPGYASTEIPAEGPPAER